LGEHPVVGWRHHIGLIVMAVSCLIIDLFTKELALARLSDGRIHSWLDGWLELKLVFNPGAAFSMGPGLTVFFSSLAVLALIFLTVVVAPRAEGWVANLLVGLLIAGVAGNLTDRLLRPPAFFRGHVIDFIAVKYFAVFNFADICLTVSVIVVFVIIFFGSKPSQPAQS